MTLKMRIWWVLSVLLVFANLQNCANGEPQVPCFFIFGDSLSDSGNNNMLQTFAKANYPPYGVDFPNGPTGRFTNGRTAVDIIGQLLGLDNFIPPFATASGSDVLKGVNYASGSAGIRDETGKISGDNIALNKQLQNHQTTVSKIGGILGSNQTAAGQLSKCLYVVNMGSNDYIDNYFLPLSPTRRQFNPEQYATVLIKQYSQQIRTLYDLGARKFALFGLGPIGCTPNIRELCLQFISSPIQLFNGKLQSLVDQLNTDLSDAKFIYLNSTNIALSIGIRAANIGCCPVGVGLCIPYGIPCPNRNDYFLFDIIHPTEAVNNFVATRSYIASDPSDAYPMDISRLVKL